MKTNNGNRFQNRNVLVRFQTVIEIESTFFWFLLYQLSIFNNFSIVKDLTD